VHSEEVRLPDDDEPVSMAKAERIAWAYLTAVVSISGVYFIVVISRAVSQPIDQVSWVAPMLLAIGLGVLGTIVGAIIGSVVGGIGIKLRGGDAAVEFASDARDEEIRRVGDRASMGVTAAGFGGALILAMLGADTFWIGNALYLAGAVGAVAETVTKIRFYRRGF